VPLLSGEHVGRRGTLYTDTHCHLGLLEGLGAETAVERARLAGVRTVIDVGTDLASSAQCVGTASAMHGVYAAVGIHPHNAIEATEHVLRLLASLARHRVVVGIGETGLDYFRDHSPPVRQREAFREHVRLAKELDKTLIVHNREATADILAILDDERAPARVVFHCFGDDLDLAKACAERGWFLSFAGNVTFRNAPQLREAAAATPLELLLTETDAPYLSPHPHRGQPNEPARVALTVAQLAELHDLPAQEMGRITSSNARRAFALPGA
jgi:TatD DNase family protein